MRGGLINDVYLKYPFQTVGFEGECSKRFCGVSKLVGYSLVELDSTEEFDFMFDDGYTLKITGDIYTGPTYDKNNIPYDLDDRFDNVEFKHLDQNGNYLTNFAEFDKHVRLFFELLENISDNLTSPRIPFDLEKTMLPDVR